ncbi:MULTISPECIES: class I SAM-dependent methyltransferase [unclassified Pseudomonas]|uniref:class I SAM-dependent methyltransferase n=1 Tax=unclassified Pseudomonas TaxID=196821 RepID=UPI00200E64A0|nr:MULTISPECIES: methyltransferase domain-containing protein [unclassified Pseudomonas]
MKIMQKCEISARAKEMDNQNSLLSFYVCPSNGSSLETSGNGLKGAQQSYPFLREVDGDIPDFRADDNFSNGGLASLDMYDFDGARTVYRNFLSWMFRTFAVDEDAFRLDLVSRLNLKPNSRVLITGCGIGDDVFAVQNCLGPEGAIFASDLAPEMVMSTYDTLTKQAGAGRCQISLSVANACNLPFEDGFFDAAFHFGGINLFDDVKGAIAEMARVTKNGGRVVFGDEGVAPWLRETDYGRMVIANNYLWAHEAPLGLLPFSAINPSVSWVLGNCFYVVQFDKSAEGPYINPDIPHVGRRGGTMRTRHLGQLEGVDLKLKEEVVKSAAAQGISVAEWLEKAIENTLGSKP